VRKILVVEDEPVLALDLEIELRSAGYQVVGPAATTSQALALLEAEGCDLAVLDVNLGRETSEAVAVALKRTSTPFIVISGYSAAQQPAILAEAVRLPKPVILRKLLHLISSALDGKDAAGQER
jgi:DNA-binding response OmpR family regulator